jgi:hypothetical protein
MVIESKPSLMQRSNPSIERTAQGLRPCAVSELGPQRRVPMIGLAAKRHPDRARSVQPSYLNAKQSSGASAALA